MLYCVFLLTLHIMLKNIQHVRLAFTLIELLTVIAIIGILAGIIIPSISTMKTKAQKAQAQSNARQIAMAYNTLALDGKNIGQGGPFSTQTNPHNAADIYEWAGVLAHNAGLDDASIWYIEVDGAAPPNIPNTVLAPGLGDRGINPAFAGTSLGWTVVYGMPKSAPASKTPLLWTRGLQPDGSWTDKAIGEGESNKSVWGDAGGHIAYLDAHVEWKSGTAENNDAGDFINIRTNEPTKNFNDAIGASAESIGVFAPE